MISVNITESSFRGVIAGLKKYGEEVKAGVMVEVKSSLLRITDRAKSNITRNRSVRTSSLIKSITYRYSSKKLGGQVFSRVKYAEDVEGGTKPHIITVKNKMVLAAPLSAGDFKSYTGRKSKILTGRTKSGRAKYERFKVFGKIVRHPGTRPKPFMMPAAETERPIFNNNIRKVLIKHDIK